MMKKRTIYLLLLHAENEITEHSQQVGRLFGKVRKGCTAGSLTAHGTDSKLDYLHNPNMGIGVSLKVPKCEIFDHMDSRCLAQTRTGIGLLGKPPAEKHFLTVESLLRDPTQTQV
jgi:hypothetical protein